MLQGGSFPCVTFSVTPSRHSQVNFVSSGSGGENVPLKSWLSGAEENGTVNWLEMSNRNFMKKLEEGFVVVP